jgi:glycerol-3-phosphate dehydrogenase (NAD(P)+)
VRRYHERARERGVNPVAYWLLRAILQPFFHLYFRMSRIGREHVPDGPVIFASNHRSFIDPFIIGTITRRPIYYVAKRELFDLHPVIGRLLNALGAFPVHRGTGDAEMIETAKAILARGDSVLMFPEGTRTRPGTLGRPKRGVGRLALESGAPVVPVAVIGTERIRRGWFLRPHKVRLRVGRPLTFPRVEAASPHLATAVTDRIWPNVMLQWEWLGGLAPLRRAAVVGSAGATVVETLRRAGVSVETGEPADLGAADLVIFTSPAGLARHSDRIGPRTGVLLPPGPVPRTNGLKAWATGTLSGLDGDGPLRLDAADAAFRRQVGDALAAGAPPTVPARVPVAARG